MIGAIIMTPSLVFEYDTFVFLVARITRDDVSMQMPSLVAKERIIEPIRTE